MVGTVKNEIGAHEIFHGVSITVVGSQRLWVRQVPIMYFRDTALLWLADTVMNEVGSH